MLSKMHYALEMAELGDKVYFVNPPQKLKQRKLAVLNTSIKKSGIIFIDTKSLQFSLFLRYNLFFLYRYVSRLYIKAIRKIIGIKIDEVWCFDPNTYVNLRDFKAGKTYSMLYDLYSGKPVETSILSADLFVTVSKHLLDSYSHLTIPKMLMQHGLGKHFSALASDRLRLNSFELQGKGKIKIGYVGNLLRGGIDMEMARKIIKGHPDKEFHFWGPYSVLNNNVVRNDTIIPESSAALISFLQEQDNVFLHGVKEQQELATEIQQMDAFLFLYQNKKDLNSASNSHKLMEYLSTGKVIVSTFVSNYADSNLLVMSKESNPEDLFELFQKVVTNLSFYNSADNQKERVVFALGNSYKQQIERIREKSIIK